MTLTRLTFEVSFHGPVRVGTGRAGRGLDDTVDPEVVVPGSSLKGLMRAEAVALLGPTNDLVSDVFGTPRSPSVWHWSDIIAAESDSIRVAARIRMDNEAGSAIDGALFLADHQWPDTARFDVIRFGAVEPGRLRQHELVLTAAGASLRSVGADRNRGFGWVEVRRVDSGFNDALYEEIVELVGAKP